MNQLPADLALLYFVVDLLEEKGVTHKLEMFSINESLLSEINLRFSTDFSLSDFQKAADKCLAHEWIEKITKELAANKYNNLGITQKGIGVARSKRKADELKASRNILKKASDYVEEHKGIFILLGSIIGLTMLGLKIFGE